MRLSKLTGGIIFVIIAGAVAYAAYQSAASFLLIDADAAFMIP